MGGSFGSFAAGLAKVHHPLAEANWGAPQTGTEIHGTMRSGRMKS